MALSEMMRCSAALRSARRSCRKVLPAAELRTPSRPAIAHPGCRRIRRCSAPGTSRRRAVGKCGAAQRLSNCARPRTAATMFQARWVLFELEPHPCSPDFASLLDVRSIPVVAGGEGRTSRCRPGPVRHHQPRMTWARRLWPLPSYQSYVAPLPLGNRSGGSYERAHNSGVDMRDHQITAAGIRCRRSTLDLRLHRQDSTRSTNATKMRFPYLP